MNEIKNCPFCGAKPFQRGWEYGFVLECGACSANGPVACGDDDIAGPKMALDMWNKRIIENA